ncbi:hypothetical protein DFP72DRAFT_1079199 [Ephemerocybe angulata]|uniref:DUF6589 domain-containing protein n=1 Tax=Ephemerocybe angulata TaxID=980116 RepID=A0A8H6HBH9_9AGAR|nr:hypothetical protein DFP72DRAFT_1079199 [Tulosesus angulatus]
MPPKYPGEGSFSLESPTDTRNPSEIPETPHNVSGMGFFALDNSYASRMGLGRRRSSQQLSQHLGQLTLDSRAQGMPQRVVSEPQTPFFSQAPTRIHTPAPGPSTSSFQHYSPEDDSNASAYWPGDETTFNESSGNVNEFISPALPSPFTQPVPPPQKYTTEERTKRAKVLKHLDELSAAKVTILDVLDYVIEGDGDFSGFRNALIAKNRTHRLTETLSRLYANDKLTATVNGWMFPHALDLVCEAVHSEMDAAKPAVKMYANEVTPEFIEGWDITDTMAAIETPVWSRILDAATETKVSKNKVRTKKPRRNREMGRAIVTAQVFYLRSQVSQRIQLGIGLMAWSTGASKQLIDVLHQSAISIPYSTIREVIKELSNGAIRKASLASKGPHSLAYDNINISTSIFVEQGPNTPSKMQSGTFSLIYELYGANVEDMKVAPLYDNLLAAGPLQMSAVRPTKEQLTSYLHQSTVTVAQILFQYVPGFENIATLPSFQYETRHALPPTHKTGFFALRATTIEEASVEGNLLVHDDIYRVQLGRDPDTLSDIAIPLFADQLTLARVRGAQELRKEDVDAWERRYVFQLAPGVFHLIMNLIWSLLHTHRGTLSQVGSLTHWFAVLEKTRLGGEHPDYHTLIAALTQILHGLILRAWQIESKYDDLADFVKSSPSADLILALARKILRNHTMPATAPAPTDPKAPPTDFAGKQPDAAAADVVHNNIVLLIRDLMYVIELVKAVETGDWGRIEDVLPTIACMFRGAGSNNYSNEMLHVLYNIRPAIYP